MADELWIVPAQSTQVRCNGWAAFHLRSTIFDFVGGEIPIVLSGNSLTAYSKGLLPTGEISLTHTSSNVFVNNENAIAFSIDASQPQWLADGGRTTEQSVGSRSECAH